MGQVVNTTGGGYQGGEKKLAFRRETNTRQLYPLPASIPLYLQRRFCLLSPEKIVADKEKPCKLYSTHPRKKNGKILTSTHLAFHPQTAHAVRRHLDRQVAPQDVVREVRPSPVSGYTRTASQAREERRPDVGQAAQYRRRFWAALAAALHPRSAGLIVRGERVHEREDLKPNARNATHCWARPPTAQTARRGEGRSPRFHTRGKACAMGLGGGGSKDKEAVLRGALGAGEFEFVSTAREQVPTPSAACPHNPRYTNTLPRRQVNIALDVKERAV